MRLEEIKGELHLCSIITFFVNALTSVVVTEQVPINTNLFFSRGLSWKQSCRYWLLLR